MRSLRFRWSRLAGPGLAGGLVGVLVLALLVYPTAAGARSGPASAAPDPRPNILLMMTDDQTVESLRVMDNVQRLLVDRGTRFANSFASWPLCCPSRASLLTGQYAHNHGVLGNREPSGGYYKLNSANTLAVWLQEAGYHTSLLGKYLNRYGTQDPTEVPPGWSDWHASVDPSTYHFRDFTLNENGTPTRYQGQYQTDVYAEKAANMVRRNAARPEPFFTWVSFLAPHTGGPREPGDPQGATPAVADRHRDAFASEELPRDPSYNELDVSDKPRHIRSLPLLTPADTAVVREHYQQRLESLLAVDEAVGRILQELQRSGEADKTLVVFTSDNGFFHGEHRVRTGKELPYEPSARVPMILRGPGIPAGVTRTQPVANIDIAPTFVALAKTTAGRVLDGRSLLPLAVDPNAGRLRPLLLEVKGGGRLGIRDYAAVRTPRFMYSEYDYQDGGPRNVELYDMLPDRHQLRSRHDDPGYAGRRADLARLLDRLRTCAGAGCR